MDQEAASLIFAMSLFLACCCSWKRAGMAIRKSAKVWEKEPAGIAAAAGVVLPLFGLLVAFDLPRVGRKVHKYRELVGPQTLGFAVVAVTTVFVVLNIEFPRQGLFRADADDQVLIDLREG